MQVACIIPTFNGEKNLIKLLESFKAQLLPFDLFVVDSGSNDNTQAIALRSAKSVTLIQNKDFNHGGTRQYMFESIPSYDIYIYLTQDVILANSKSLMLLIEPFSDPSIGATFGKQLPHNGATSLARFSRIYNYPDEFRRSSICDVRKLGIKSYFLSNSFAAYRSEALHSVGGFPKHVILGEDMYVACKMINGGWKTVYTPYALCYHSHNYTLMQEFQRYFDTGVFHSREAWIIDSCKGVRSEGLKYVISEIRFVLHNNICELPNQIIRTILKYIAYNIGKKESLLPISLKKYFSMHKSFWS